MTDGLFIASGLLATLIVVLLIKPILILDAFIALYYVGRKLLKFLGWLAVGIGAMAMTAMLVIYCICIIPMGWLWFLSDETCFLLERFEPWLLRQKKLLEEKRDTGPPPVSAKVDHN
jgi:predicted exporter